MSESGPVRRSRRGRAPAAISSSRARVDRAPGCRIDWRGRGQTATGPGRPSDRPARRSAAPSSTSDLACSSSASDGARTSTESARRSRPGSPPSARPDVRRAIPSSRGAPKARERARSSAATSRADSRSPTARWASARSVRHSMNTGAVTPDFVTMSRHRSRSTIACFGRPRTECNRPRMQSTMLPPRSPARWSTSRPCSARRAIASSGASRSIKAMATAATAQGRSRAPSSATGSPARASASSSRMRPARYAIQLRVSETNPY